MTKTKLDSAGEKMKEIESLKTQYRISDFITWQRDGLLILNPNFQRRSVWKKGAKSYLIDTIIRGLPIPIIFLRDLHADLKTFKSKRDVVDGQQRLRTILTFVAPNLLADFNHDKDAFTISRAHNKALADKTFQELPENTRQRILDYQFSVHSFNADTDDKEILQIFARMNSSGYKLNAQELRNAKFFGDFKQAAYELATEQLNRWRDWAIFTSDQISRMQEVELTSELFILMLVGITGRSVPNIDRYYKDYDEEFPSRTEIESRFHDVFSQIDILFGEKNIKTLFSNKSMFYALFSVVYDGRFGLRSGTDFQSPLTVNQDQLTKQRPNTIEKSKVAQILRAAQAIHDDTAPPAVQRALRGATSDLGSRQITARFLNGVENA